MAILEMGDEAPAMTEGTSDRDLLAPPPTVEAAAADPAADPAAEADPAAADPAEVKRWPRAKSPRETRSILVGKEMKKKRKKRRE